MISKSIVNAVLKAATTEAKDSIIRLFLNHIGNNYDYNDIKASHLLECLVDKSAIIEINDINLDYIKNHLDLLIRTPEDYSIKDIALEYTDNIDCIVSISFKYIEKINEDRSDISYAKHKSYINWLEFPKVLKNS